MTSSDAARPARRSPHTGSVRCSLATVAIVVTLAMTAGCSGGGDDNAGPGRGERASTGPAAPAPVAPVDPPTDDGADTGGAPGGAVDFADVFGPPTGRLGGDDGTESTEPDEPSPTEPPTTAPEPAPTQPPSAPSPTPAPAPVPTEPGAPAPVRTPVAPLAPDVLTFLAGLDAANQAINAEDPTVPRLTLPYEAFSVGPSVTISGGQVAALRLDGGLIAVLLDTDNTVAGALVYGVSSSEVVSAVITMVLAHGDEAAFRDLLGAWDAAVAADGETVFPDSDGGHWVVSSSDGVASLVKLQDASSDWVTANHLLFQLDAILVLPSPNP